MQPAPTDNSKTDLNPYINPIDQSPTSQHGSRPENDIASVPLQNAEAPADGELCALHDEADDVEPAHVLADGGEGGWLKGDHDASSEAYSNSSGGSEYHLALDSIPLDGGRERLQAARSDGSLLSRMPNEILTHALSYLSPVDLAAVALVSRRLHALVTSPHAWMMAFSRLFPRQDPLPARAGRQKHADDDERMLSDRRYFSRLTGYASWRSEYILRTRLLRSIARGKPARSSKVAGVVRGGSHRHVKPIIKYFSLLNDSITHIHASFGSTGNMRHPKLIHGTAFTGAASLSSPSTGEASEWGLGDPHAFSSQFADRFPGEDCYGLGTGKVVGGRNVMDVSQEHGMVLGECFPGGGLYFRHVDEMRGRYLLAFTDSSNPQLGIPRIRQANQAVCSVWIAKTTNIPRMTGGLVGIMAGSSGGVVSAYSLGSNGFRDVRLGRGEITARWVLSPGVPIIALAIDESYTLQRLAQNRIWAVALNALGEIFYLTKLPKRPLASGISFQNEDAQEHLAWTCARSVYWNMVEPSRRVARDNPYDKSAVTGSYTPRSSWDGLCLSSDQITAETKEVESFLRKQPWDFRQACRGWDMQRRLEVDFAGDDGNHAGESVVVFECGIEEDDVSAIKRFTRMKARKEEMRMTPTIDLSATSAKDSQDGNSASGLGKKRTPCESDLSVAQDLDEEWICSGLSLGDLGSVRITCTALDYSTTALLTTSEESTVSRSGRQGASARHGTSVLDRDYGNGTSDIPGQRARFVAAGTASGTILVWNMRAAVAKSAELLMAIDPLRIISTTSSQISCLGLTALYVVHGGNDGLVQAWDVLGSTEQPLRALRSRATAYARRRLAQDHGNMVAARGRLFAATAIALDPDPTVLQGVVGCGTHLWYWSFSSSSADQYKGRKRRIRRSERGSNHNFNPNFNPSSPSNFAKSSLKGYIADEKIEHDKDEARRRKDADRLAGRFGLDLLGNEEEMLAYATMLSNESLEHDLLRRQSGSSSNSSDFIEPRAGSSNNITPIRRRVAEGSPVNPALSPDTGTSAREVTELGPYNQSFEPVDTRHSRPNYDIPIRYAKARQSTSPASKHSPPQTSLEAGTESYTPQELADLELALQLSMVEQ